MEAVDNSSDDKEDAGEEEGDDEREDEEGLDDASHKTNKKRSVSRRSNTSRSRRRSQASKRRRSNRDEDASQNEEDIEPEEVDAPKDAEETVEDKNRRAQSRARSRPFSGSRMSNVVEPKEENKQLVNPNGNGRASSRRAGSSRSSRARSSKRKEDEDDREEDLDEAENENANEGYGEEQEPMDQDAEQEGEAEEEEEEEETSTEDASDDSSDEELSNRVGEIPMHWYDEYDHIGYNIDGKKVLKKSQGGDQLDAFLARKDDPNYWRTIHDDVTGEDIVLTEQELSIIRRIQTGQYAHANFDPYDTYVEFDYPDGKIHPIGGSDEPKRRFIPSKWEGMKINRLVEAIRKGLIKKEQEKPPVVWDLWNEEANDEKDMPKMPASAPPPKPKLPGHAESYNPPDEYLPTEEEKNQWALVDPEDRPYNFIPNKYNALRKVPLYSNFIQERFERCLDLYLAPRALKKRLNIDPESLIPKLPKPSDLRPFPTTMSIQYLGHTERIRAISIDPTGQWLASGSDDKTVRIWEIETGRCFWQASVEDTVHSIAWNPDVSIHVLAAAVGDKVLLYNPGLASEEDAEKTEGLLRGEQKGRETKTAVEWHNVDADSEDYAQGLRVEIQHEKDVKSVIWHAKGDYFASVSTEASPSSQVLIHSLSRQSSQKPFAKSKGLVQKACFHPSKPFFFVATQQHVRVYHLQEQKLIKKLLTGMKWISSLSIHPGGDNLIVGSYDKKMAWFDMDLSSSPYKTLKYHNMAIRNVTFHRKYPLFASCSDDGSVHVFHGMVYSDLMQNPLIVPVKILRGHEVVSNLGVLDCSFHPTQPWIISSGADNTIRLWI
eukprot:GILK01006373.1.p1 GENE.GILK01006373.1~~GILK01006373.1.p1  ORF type:complete len:908 (-),score=186.22 GILK01006373.1:272-2764(-)